MSGTLPIKHLPISDVILLQNSFCLYQTGSDGALTEKPADAVLRPDGSLRLNCSSDIPNTPVLWYFTEDGSNESQPMTSGPSLTPSFSDSFTIDSSNEYDLLATMTSDTEQYCGTYECVDNNGGGETASAAVSS